MFMIQDGLLLTLVLLLLNGGLIPIFIYKAMETPFGQKVAPTLHRWLCVIGLAAADQSSGPSIGLLARLLVIAITLPIGVGVYAFGSLFWWTLPVGVEAWVDLIGALFALNFTGSQVIHGAKRLGPKLNQ